MARQIVRHLEGNISELLSESDHRKIAIADLKDVFVDLVAASYET